jgi:hypothetical protein
MYLQKGFCPPPSKGICYIPFFHLQPYNQDLLHLAEVFSHQTLLEKSHRQYNWCDSHKTAMVYVARPEQCPHSQSFQGITRFYMEVRKNAPLSMSQTYLIIWTPTQLSSWPDYHQNSLLGIYVLLCLFLI